MNPEARKIVLGEREGATIGPGGEVIFPKNRVAACMILGDNYQSDELIACVNSVKAAGIDKLFIAFNGKTRRSLQWLFKHLGEIGLPFNIKKFGWENDFALARNQSFSLVPKDEFDWIIWIDSDDELIVETPIDELIASIDPYTQGVFLRYDYATDPTTGEVTVQQWRERILTTKANWTWVYPIHEVIFAPSGVQFAKRDGIYVKHAAKPNDGGNPLTRVRNRKIIAHWLKENPKHPRAQFYFANEAMAEAESENDPNVKERLCNAAVLAFKRFLSNPEAPKEDLYIAATRMADLLLTAGRPDEAIDAYLSSMKIIPDWPDAFIGIARAAMELEDWPRCKSFTQLALKMDPPQTASAVTPLTYKYTPLLLLAIAEENMGDFEAAKNHYIETREIWNPPNGMLDDKIKNVVAKLAVQKPDKDERKTLRGSRAEKSIAFVTAPLVESWHPELEKQNGAGGAETCIMRLAPRFAADGWRVAVFGTPGEYRGVDDNRVEWWDSMEFLPNERFKVVVGSRVPEIFDGDVYANHKLLWMHDVNVGLRLGALHQRVDRIIGLTMWHARHLSDLYNIPITKFSVIPNGIELDLYDNWNEKETTDELRFIWSSSADRGLTTLLALWPTMKKIFPTSRLDIFYGWNIIDRLIKKGRIGLDALKSEIVGNIDLMGGEDFGIYQHGRVPQTELAEWQKKAHIWPYPTDFMETFCITAIEMQAAGVIPVVSDLAALTETIASKELLVKGWPRNMDYQKRFLRKIVEVVESGEEKIIGLQSAGREIAEDYTWDKSYSKWMDLIRRLDG